MSPRHHPYPETLMSYAAGTLLGAATCVVACHLSLCSECAAQVRWLERVGGVMLSKLDPEEDEPAVTKPAPLRSGRVQSRPGNQQTGQISETSDPWLTAPLARFSFAHGMEISWTAGSNGVEEHSIPDGGIRLLRLDPGQRLPDHDATSETELALVLQGACRDNARIYIRGDVIEMTEGATRPPAVFGESECICLVTAKASDDVKPRDPSRLLLS